MDTVTAPMGGAAGEDDDLAGRPSARVLCALRHDPAAWLGAGLVLSIAAAAILAPVLSGHDPEHQYRELMDGRYALPPGGPFLLGTDTLGRDLLSRLLHGGRATLLVAATAATLALIIGAVVGIVAGYAGTPRLRFRGRLVGVPVEGLLMRVADIGLAFPTLLLAIAMAAVFHPSLQLAILVIVSALWAGTARIVYARTLVLRRAEFVLAATALGTTPMRVMTRHLLPHLVPLLLVLLVMGIAVTVLFEVTLTYLGAGVPAGSITWGRMLTESVSAYNADLRLPLLPALCIFLTVYGFSLLGDALRDALDPRSWDR